MTLLNACPSGPRLGAEELDYVGMPRDSVTSADVASQEQKQTFDDNWLDVEHESEHVNPSDNVRRSVRGRPPFTFPGAENGQVIVMSTPRPANDVVVPL